MKRVVSSMQSRVAKRILLLFVLCALLPTGSLALYSLWQLRGKLMEENALRLRQATKHVGMSIPSGFLLVEDELRFVASVSPGEAGEGLRRIPRAGDDSMALRYRGLTWIREGGDPVPLYGRVSDLPPLSGAVRRHAASGKSAVIVREGPDGSVRIYMVTAARTGRGPEDLLVAELNPEFLRELALRSLPPEMDLAVLGPGGIPLFGSRPVPGNLVDAIRTKHARAYAGQFEWEDAGEPRFVSYWSVFLKPSFLAEEWVVATSRSRAAVFAPVGRFTGVFIGILLLGLLVASLLGVGQIRRSLIPLARLREGTRRIGRGDFERRVVIRSGDEFEELADSFNTMAEKLQREFMALEETGEIVRAILTALDRERIAEAVLGRIRRIVSCDLAALTLIDPGERGGALTFRNRFPSGDGKKPESVMMRVSREELGMLRVVRSSVRADSPGLFPSLLRPLADDAVGSFVLFPIRANGFLTGVLTLGYGVGSADGPEDLLRIRPIADQVAVALTNADLLLELSALNWGILNALARAVDTKSPWTAGHSERVAVLSLRIGKALHLSPEEQETLHRAALLHDLGKIGVPVGILDKREELTDEEWNVMKEHPGKGARILDPIPAFRNILPVVSQHHERYDGRGYPRGMTGEAISRDARIVAVADVFDALVSNRPYRVAWERESIIAYFREGAGTLFDPAVVRAFEQVMREESPEAPREAGIYRS